MLSLLALAVSCGGRPEYPGCDADKHCRAKEVCANHRCRQCAEDRHCDRGMHCFRGACLVDNRCNDDDQCPDGRVCLQGACSQCTADRQCGTMGRCQDGQCLTRGICQVDEDCGDDENCLDGRCEKPGRTVHTPADCGVQSLYFDLDSSRLRDDHKEALRQIADCLREHEGRVLFVEGHTDPRGTEEYNIALSELRASTVTGYLKRLGVLAEQLRVIPRGETESTGLDSTGWNLDRKVIFEWQ